MTISLAGIGALGLESGTPLDASDMARSSSPVPAPCPQPGHTMESAAALLFFTDQEGWWDMLYNIMNVQSFSTNSQVQIFFSSPLTLCPFFSLVSSPVLVVTLSVHLALAASCVSVCFPLIHAIDQ